MLTPGNDHADCMAIMRQVRSMKKIMLTALVLLACPGLILQTHAQTAEDFERTGLKHLKDAYFKALPQKNNQRANTEFALAEKAFKKAIAIKPGSVDPYLHLGRTYHLQKKYHQAANMYRLALDLAPHEKKIYLKLASAQEMAGDYEAAVKTLQDLREQETDPRAVRILDGFIHKIQMRAEDMEQENQP
jgi:Flp pilus assembly protein TadD